ncbi:hypothetical protein PENTCL1PPCAC_26358, partial [Pristionchus entomophagus]
LKPISLSLVMKKEWMLNDEKLSRREISRLSNMVNRRRNPNDPSRLFSIFSILSSHSRQLPSPPSRHG